MKPLVLSHFEVKPLLEAKRQQRESVVSSGDLGRTKMTVLLQSEGCVWSERTDPIRLPGTFVALGRGPENELNPIRHSRADRGPVSELNLVNSLGSRLRGNDGEKSGDGGGDLLGSREDEVIELFVRWSALERIAEEEKKCFLVDGDSMEELRTFSEVTQWVRSLWPTGRAPTTVVAGFPMHRIQGIDPLEDTKRKAEGAAPFTGRVLDTATGLGYTAIYAARFAPSVVTVELDPAAIELAKKNPWSRELFESPKITQHIGDVTELILGFERESFSQIIHDPPTFKLGGELYSTEFYRELHRVLKKNGRVSHYIGDPESTSGKRTTRGVIQRLQDAGFARVTSNPKAFGVVATK